jgi:hypothetical protein
MTLQRSFDDHARVSGLIPWYVNGTAGDDDRVRVEDHVRDCARCRADLEQERRVYEAMSADPGVEFMPAASLKKLTARLDAFEASAGAGPAPLAPASSAGVVSAPSAATGAVLPASAAPVPSAGATPSSPLASSRARMPWRGLAAASIILAAFAVSLVTADQWLKSRAASYHTVTASAARPPEEAIRAVFAPGTTLAELQSMLDEAGLRIVSGPTEAGVYSLASTSPRPVSASLRTLRAHASVRFAESTR